MLCEKCGKREATVYIKNVLNGEQTELHLCGACAEEEGVMQAMNPFAGFNNFFGGFFGQLPSTEDTPKILRDDLGVCPVCGARASDIARSGRAGCPDCYTRFDAVLHPLIRRIHGGLTHTGGVPGSAGVKLQKKQRLEALKKDMKEAVKAQEFEKAAQLRDEINAIEQENGGHQNA